MPRHFFAFLTVVSLAIFVSADSLRASDLLDEVPNDALGFVYVHNLSAVDAKVGRLAAVLQHSLPRPLAFLQQMAGVSEGLKSDGDFMLVLFPDGGDSGGAWRYCVWVPVADYDKFLNSVHAKSVEGIATATIAGEDLLVARHEDWALVMDPDQRERLTELAAATPAPPPMPGWKPWMNSNDIAVVGFAPGLRELQNWVDEDAGGDERSGSSAQAGGAFGPANPNGGSGAIQATRATSDVAQNAKIEFRKWLAAAPELSQALQQVTAAAVGVRLDESGNATAGVRVAINKEFTDELVSKTGKINLPDSAYGGGGFTIAGGGRAAPSLLGAIACAYTRRTAADLVQEEKTELEPESLKQLVEAIEKATGQVKSVVVLSQPGEQPQPVYTNNFTVLRVQSATSFADQANEVMRLWNTANRDAKGGTHMVFDVDETKVGEHAATQYGLDVAALDGGAVLPEVRQAMEKMFGAGGKLRVWIVPTDENTVLLATATAEQVAAAVKLLERKQPMDWEGSEFAAASLLTSADADWRLFIDGHRYNDWAKRESMAMIGVPVVGGPLVLDFPTSPPLALAGGIRDGEVWLDGAALASTIKSADVYWLRSRARNALQMRGRIIVPGRPPAVKPN